MIMTSDTLSTMSLQRETVQYIDQILIVECFNGHNYMLPIRFPFFFLFRRWDFFTQADILHVAVSPFHINRSVPSWYCKYNSWNILNIQYKMLYCFSVMKSEQQISVNTYSSVVKIYPIISFVLPIKVATTQETSTRKK